ncbi:MAG: AmmeMemoRadiSam system protein A, partial [Pseudomonadota bacterium]
RLGAFSVLPLIVGEIAPAHLSGLIEKLWGGPETLIVISTDLTHFLTADRASRIDARTAAKIETSDPDGLTGREACGVVPLGAFLSVAGRKGLRMTRLALTHSGAVTGDRSRVVGYGAWMAQEPGAVCLGPEERKTALTLARTTLEQRTKSPLMPNIRGVFPPPLDGHGACFVTIEKDGELRGCVGSLRAHRSLKGDIIVNSVKAGFEDPRFDPMTLGEVDAATLEIAVLSSPAPMTFGSERDLIDQLTPGRDGLILDASGQRGTFLPKVWKGLLTPEAFWTGLKRKAGLDDDFWSSDVRVWRFVAESFSD